MTLTRARTIQYVGILFALALIAVGYWYWSARAGVKTNTSALQPQGTGRLDSGLVGYWKLDETTGSSAADASTNGNNGTLVNMENGDWVAGRIGNGLDFDGSNEQMTAPGANPIDIRSSMTLSTWAKLDTLPGNGESRAIFRKTAASGANHLYTFRFTNVGYSTYNLLFTPGGGGAFNYSNGFVATTGTWYLLTVTYDAGTDTVTHYFNGVPVGTNTDTVGGGYAGGTGDLYIGSAGGSEYFDGQLDEMRIYDRVLSADEVGQLYRQTSPTSVDTSLKAYWSFDGDTLSGTTASDRSGTGNHGAMNNGPAARKGVVGQALNFDGSNDSITSSSNSPALASLTQASVAFWINPRGAGYQGGIFSTLAADGGGNGSFSNGFMVSGDTWNGTQTIRFVADGSAGDMQTRSTSVLPLNSWTHIVVVWDGSLTAAATKFYVNGVLDKTTGMGDGSGSFVPSNGNFSIGRMVGSYTLDGLLDELRVYNRVLTAAEAKGLYDIAKPDAANSASSQAQGVGRLDSGLSAYFRFDDGTSGATPTTAADSSVNGLTAGTLTNGPTWTAGQIGSAVAFDGTNDSVYVASATAFDIALGEKVTTAFWYTANQADGTAAGVYDAASAFGGCAHNQVALTGGASTDVLNFYYRTDNCNGVNAVQITGVSKNVWHHVVSTYDSSTGAFAAYLDGTLKATATAALDINMNLTDLNIGGGGGQYLLGSVDEFRFYRRALSSDEVGALYRLTSPTSIDTSLKGYWSFNGQDMSGTTAYDRSGAGNTGTLTNSPTIDNGIVGQALSFDGTNDYVDAGNGSSVKPSFPFTISTWTKFNSLASNPVVISSSDTGGFGQYSGFYIQVLSTGAIIAQTGDNTTCCDPGPRKTVATAAGAVVTGNWYHIAVVFTSINSFTIYVNGIVQTTTTSGNATYMAYATNNKLRIGAVYDANATADVYMNGLIDEVRLYNRSLSAAEIKGLYDVAKPDAANSSSSQAQGTGRLDSGLVGYWPLDNGSGTAATDLSTNNNTGTLANGPAWTTGRIGGAVTFDGSDDFISTGVYIPYQFANQAFTAAGWFKKSLAGGSNYIIAQGGCTGGWLVRLDTGTLLSAVRGSGACGSVPVQRSSASTTLNDDSWHHFAAVITTSTTANSGNTITLYVDGTLNQGALTQDGSNVYLPVNTPLTIGSRDGTYDGPFNGSLDEMRVYNRGLSADEVSQLYRLGTPTGTDTSLKGYWSFNGQDMNATTAFDRSGSAINGTLAGNTRAVRGKLGQALSFDGTGDYVNLGNTLELGLPMTVSAWINLSAYPASAGGILTTDKTNPGDHLHTGMWFQVNSSGVLGVNYGDNTNCNGGGRRTYNGARALALNTWYHVTAIVSGPTDMKLYIDGAEDAGTYDGSATGGAIAYAAYSAAIGRMTDCPGGAGLDFPGKIDEVRIYNRALSETEVQTIYKQNK